MPKIMNDDVYEAIFEAGTAYFAGNPDVDAFKLGMRDSTVLYRYVGYRSGRPQEEESGRTIWAPLSNDVTNRWTGQGSDGNGAQGLYLSVDGPGGANTSFAELLHYQDATVPPNQNVSYYEYKSGVAPEWKTSTASELRTMFMFTLNRQLDGIDLSYTEDSTSPIHQIFELAKKDNPALFAGMTVESLYFDSNDASYTRAVGNAALLCDYDFIKTTSVRDRAASNIVIPGQSRVPLDMLIPEGRATFFLDGVTKTCKPVFTMDDLIYNDKFDKTGKGVLPSGAELAKDFEPSKEAAAAIDRYVDWTYTRREVDTFINERVTAALQSMDSPQEKTIDELVKAIATPELNAEVRVMLTEEVTANAAAWEGYKQLEANLGAEGVRSLISAQVVEPVFRQMTDTSKGPAYTELSVRQALLEDQATYLDNNASKLQAEIAESNRVLVETNAEIEAQTEALKAVQAQLAKDPDNPSLLEQQKQIEAQLSALDAAQKKAEADREQAEEEKERNESESEANAADSEDTDEALDEAGREIFHGK